MGRLRTIAVLAGTGIAAAACASLSGLTGGPGQGDDAGLVPDAGPSPDAAPSDPCSRATYPPPPTKDDAPADEIAPVIVAVRRVSIGGALDGASPPGFDLDGVCTCFADSTTAHEGKTSCVPPDGSATACDGDGGADRQLGNLLAGYPELFAGKSADDGGPTLVLKITKYNGRANDAEVFVAAFGSDGIYDASGCGNDPGAPPYPPTWTGCDRWTLDARYVLPGTKEPLQYAPAYVTDNVLVVKGSAKPFVFLAGNTSLPVSAAVITARLVAVDAKLAPIVPPPAVGALFRIDDGIVAGRVTTTDALRGLASSQAVTDGGPLCGFQNFFNAVKTSFVCPNADISGSAAKDFAGAACDAISFGSSFAAEPAQLGDVREPPKNPCGDPNDPKFDPLYDCTK